MVIKEMKTVTLTDKGQITLPKQLRNMKGFHSGDKLVVIIHENRVELRPFGEFQEKMELLIASENSLAKEWSNPTEEKAWEYLQKEK